MQIDEAVLVVFFLDAIEGDYQFIIVLVEDLEILTNAFLVSNEHNIRP